jgi:hypothetical protein
MYKKVAQYMGVLWIKVRLANAKAFCAIGLTPSYLNHVRTRPTTKATIVEGEYMARRRSPWFSLGYLLAIAVIVLLIILFVLWLA